MVRCGSDIPHLLQFMGELCSGGAQEKRNYGDNK